MSTTKPPLESKVVKKILEQLRSRGGWWFKVWGSPMQIAGIPDIIGCYRGRFVAFEVKRAEGYEATKLQLFIMKKIRAAGGIATLIWSTEQAFTELDRIDATEEAQSHNHKSPPTS